MLTTILDTGRRNTLTQHWRKLKHNYVMVMEFTSLLGKKCTFICKTFLCPTQCFFNSAVFWAWITRMGWLWKCTPTNPKLVNSMSLTIVEESSYTLNLVSHPHLAHWCLTLHVCIARIQNEDSCKGLIPDSLMWKHLAWHNYFHNISINLST